MASMSNSVLVSTILFLFTTELELSAGAFCGLVSDRYGRLDDINSSDDIVPYLETTFDLITMSSTAYINALIRRKGKTEFERECSDLKLTSFGRLNNTSSRFKAFCCQHFNSQFGENEVLNQDGYTNERQSKQDKTMSRISMESLRAGFNYIFNVYIVRAGEEKYKYILLNIRAKDPVRFLADLFDERKNRKKKFFSMKSSATKNRIEIQQFCDKYPVLSNNKK